MTPSLPLALFALCAAPIASGVELNFNARLHLDAALHDADTTPRRDGWLMRRAALGIDGKLDADWSFAAAWDAAGMYTVRDDGLVKSHDFDAGLKDVALQYRGWPAAQLRLGQFKVPFGMDELSSSSQRSLVEAALPVDALALSRRLGIGLSRNRDRYSVSGMAFGSSLSGSDRGRGMALRLTAVSLYWTHALLHLGVAVASEQPRGTPAFDARPESRVDGRRLLDTGALDHVRRIDRLGLEAAWQSGPLTLQGEWMRASALGEAGHADAAFSGAYLVASWVLTGESREYRNGVFKGIPIQHAQGVWELSLRYSRLNLDDGSVQGGRERNVTLGLNYYATPHWRFMLDGIRVHSVRRGIVDNPTIVQLRAQWAY